MSELIRAFLTVFPAELPDKTMVATIVLVTRYRRPLAVWAGAAGAFAVHVVVAVAAGSAMGLLPDQVVGAVVTVLFTVGAVLLLRSARSADADDAKDLEELSGATEGGRPSGAARGAVAGSFGLVVLAEWGDLTQLATASLAARSDFPLATGVGAYLALISVAAIGALAGRQLVARFSLSRINYVGAAIFAALAVWTLVEVVRG